MNLEPSTLNILLTAILTLQAWQVREIFKVKERLSVLMNQCPECCSKYDADH